MKSTLDGQVAIVTGAARGLGLLVAEALANEGMNVVGADIRTEELKCGMAKLAERTGAKTLAVPADVGCEKDVIAMVRQTIEAFGSVSVLVNNAAIRKLAPIWETSSALWDDLQSSNLRSQFLCTREVLLQDMLRRNCGAILYVASGSGKVGEEKSAAYCASKWGVLGLAESVAKDLKHTGIRVTAITPGMIDTPMARESEEWAAGVGPWLDAQRVARAIVFCLQQPSDTVIPEMRVFHRSQL
jgi:NAD(P)-dependent dehydrogenase (short-subunit alcohol dehydrogenase family)